MDTHITPYPDPAPALAEISARLPGEAPEVPRSSATLDAGERLPSSVAKPVRGRRGMLLAGVAALSVAVAGGAFLVSPYNTVYPLAHIQASVSTATGNATRYAENAIRPILAPAASLAKVAVPPAPVVVREPYTPEPREQQRAEIFYLHPGSSGQDGSASRAALREGHPVNGLADHPRPPVAPASSAPALGAPAPGAPAPAFTAAAGNALLDYAPREPGSIDGSRPTSAAVLAPVSPSPAPQDATASVIAALPQARPGRSQGGATPAEVLPASPASPTPLLAVPPPVAGTPPAEAAPALAASTPRREPLTEAANLRASPMSTAEQVQVLNLVTEMAAMVKDLRKQQLQLRSDLARSSADMSGRLSDYERRLAFSEARNAVTAADAASDDVSPKTGAPVSDSSVGALKPIPVTVTRSVNVVASPPVAAMPKLYRVQAASPGLALLAQVDRGGGDGAQIQVVVGDTVPDYGRVKSIAQKGTAWVVTTEHGAIQ